MRIERSLLVALLAVSSTATGDDAPRLLDRGVLLGGEALQSPVPMREFAMPADATAPGSLFTGTLRLSEPADEGAFAAVVDIWDRVAEIGEPVRHLPEFEFDFVQRGGDLVPLQRGVLRRRHPYWEIILQPGRVWHEAADGDWTRASLPFALQERGANCIHNGVMSWLFDDRGRISRVAYQISSETCGYFKFDMWGLARATYRPQDFGAAASAQIARLDAHRGRRLPVRPLEQLGIDYPGTEPQRFGAGDGIDMNDMTVLGMVVDGIHYRSDCYTRQGPHPYCDSLPLPSYSTAKSVFAGVATMYLQKRYPGLSKLTVAALVPECDSKRWQDVTLENVLDMATGNYRSAVYEEDEDSIPHRDFVFRDDHQGKLAFACNFFQRKSDPGSRFVYHTSDTYLLGTALRNFLAARSIDGDLYATVLVEPIWHRLGLSPLLDDTLRSYDEAAQPFTGYGLTYEADDIARISLWLTGAARAELDERMLDAALQRLADDRGLPAGAPGLVYNNGFWGFNAGATLGCEEPVWVPFMSGVSGITVAMFPNGVIYYYYSDSYLFRWRTAMLAAQAIRSLCK
jgi:hypothetical protein